MDLNETMTTMMDYLNGKKTIELSQDDLKFIKIAFDGIKEDVDLMVIDKEPVSSEEKTKSVREAVLLVMQRTITTPLTEDHKSFLKAFGDLSFNWNNNTVKDEELHTISSFLSRTVDYHYTLIEAIQVMRLMSKHLADIKSWSPPAFEVSKHYYNILEKELTKQEPCQISDQKKSC